MRFSLLTIPLILFFTACSAPMPKPVAVSPTKNSIDYVKDVKPILDKRCVVCHSCYGLPCQAKFNSFEGIDRGANNIFLYIDMPDGTFITKNLVINRWHDNVNALFGEKSRLNPKKGTMDILDRSVGSYPNVFVVVKFKDLADFIDLMKNSKNSANDIRRMKKYFISRSDKDFWKVYDWFQAHFDAAEPVNSGLYDLNRYARSPWEKEQ